MASKKKRLPWRTLQMGGDTGRFTREQLNQAVLAVKAEQEARAARARSKKPRASDAIDTPDAELPRKKARGSRGA